MLLQKNTKNFVLLVKQIEIFLDLFSAAFVLKLAYDILTTKINLGVPSNSFLTDQLNGPTIAFIAIVSMIMGLLAMVMQKVYSSRRKNGLMFPMCMCFFLAIVAFLKLLSSVI